MTAAVATAWRLQHGRYMVPGGVVCPRCGADADRINCYPGEYPKCYLGCGAILLYLGRVPTAPCVSPNGRIDGHMAYIKGGFPGTPMTCAFCGKREGEGTRRWGGCAGRDGPPQMARRSTDLARDSGETVGRELLRPG